MSKKFINQTHIEGYVYEHRLEKRVSGPNSKNPGTPFIMGTLSIATDNDLLNVIPVHFSYVTEVTSTGRANATYTTLEAIIDGKIGSVMEHGAENAGKIRIDSAIGLNEWYDTRTPGAPLVSVKRNEGGFVHLTQELNEDESKRSTFEADMVITAATRLDEDSERELPERMILKGCIFDFRNSLLPVEFTVLNPAAMDYFEGQSPTSKTPLFTKVRGEQISKTIVHKVEEVGAWGEPSVRETRTSQRDFVVTWALSSAYEWDSEDTITAAELSEFISTRELYLANLKKRNEESANRRNSNTSTNVTASSGGYDF